MTDIADPQNIHNPETIDKVIKIINGLLFHNGRGKSFETIKSEIKGMLEISLTDFYGEDYARSIFLKLKDMNILMSIRTLGKNGSIEQLLQNKRKEQCQQFMDKYGLDYSTVASALCDMTSDLYLYVDDISSDLIKVLEHFQIQKNDFIAKRSIRHSLQNKLQKMINTFLDNVPYYSNDPYENSDCLFLEKFMNAYSDNLERRLQKILPAHNYDFFTDGTPMEFIEKMAFEENNKTFLNLWHSINLDDPIFKTLTGQADRGSKLYRSCAKFLEPSTIIGGMFTEPNTIILSTNINDHSIIHEGNHAIDRSGFERFTASKKEQDSYGDKAVYRRYEPFNEIVNDWFTKLILSKYYEKYPPLCKKHPRPSAYSVGFPMMSRFIQTLLPELKESRMGFGDPITSFKDVIGDQNFEDITQLSLDLLTMDHPEVDKPTTDPEYKQASAQLELFSDELSMKHDLIKYILVSLDQDKASLGKVIHQAINFKFANIINKLSKLMESMTSNYKPKHYKHEDFDEPENN